MQDWEQLKKEINLSEPKNTPNIIPEGVTQAPDREPLDRDE